ncbi:crossover junction endonuclease EME1 [Octopus bimaculoides]|uniref:ERCC4 domain-containing protein n=1 Tax=Octopus bimaculoides TaxID=37653 RepID=A0A0L8GP07_OCTBM|nr:crossover junction endonuclease EME1 [Octopus bimaculoides]|eukprot:XP_014779546.1 PREDICTED: crossover junction endonuclease EME1-like [Octopus bimaculoides]
MDLDVEIPLKERVLGLSSKFSHAIIDLDNENIYFDDHSHANVQFDEAPNLTQENRDLKSGSIVSNFVDVNEECADSDDSDSLPAYTELTSSHSDGKLSEFLKKHTTLNTLPQTEVIKHTTLNTLPETEVIKKKKCSSEKMAVKKVQKDVVQKSDQNGKITKKHMKEKAAQIRKAEQKKRLAYQPKECLKSMTVVIDPGVVNQPGVGTAIFSACDDLEVTYKIESQFMPYVVSWKRTTLCYDTEDQVVKTWNLDVDEKDIVIMIPLDIFTEMLDHFKTNSMAMSNVSSLDQYAENIQSLYPGYSVMLAVIGSDIGSQVSKRSGSHQSSQRKAKNGIDDRLSIEEAFLTLQLKNLFNCQLIQSSSGITNLIKSFTKAVGEKPGKKDRLQSEFSFHNAKGNNTHGSSNIQGMWKLQLQQFKNVSSDIANAIVFQYPTPKSLFEAYEKCSSEKEGIKVLEDITVRRHAGVLQSTKRIGKEAARRIYQLMTSKDPNLLLK